jgi:hypothetical protein
MHGQRMRSVTAERTERIGPFGTCLLLSVRCPRLLLASDNFSVDFLSARRRVGFGRNPCPEHASPVRNPTAAAIRFEMSLRL